MRTSRSSSGPDPGSAAAIRCDRCQELTARPARFCRQCGAPLPADQVVAAAQEVRKTVTCVFCDVVESTALGERLDPEAVRRVMSLYFEEMRRAVERHGGTVEKFIGDAVMAVFGVPKLHEDDALRAVRAARRDVRRLAPPQRGGRRRLGSDPRGAYRRRHRRGRRK